MWIVLAVLGIIVVAPVVIAIGAYNGLVTRRNRYKNAYAQIDVQLKRRYDLIPNLVEIAKKAMAHERETLEAVVAARGVAMSAARAAAANPGDPTAMRALGSAEAGLTGSLGRLLMVSEQYPVLKGDAQMTQLGEELRSTENRVAFARQAFNDAVTTYNTARETFPTVLIAGSFGFGAALLLESTETEAERHAPKVQF
jgi:LemA protein